MISVMTVEGRWSGRCVGPSQNWVRVDTVILPLVIYWVYGHCVYVYKKNKRVYESSKKERVWEKVKKRVEG